MRGSLSRYRIYGGLVNYRNQLLDLSTGFFNRSNSVETLERQMAADFQSPSAVAVPMARVGIYLAIKNLIKPGQDVLMSPYTIADVVNMVIAAGGHPRFVDVERASGNMDPEELKKRVRSNSGLILVTHLHGIAAEIEEIAGFARKVGLPVMEDCAQALGAKTDSGHLGAFGDVGVFSFGTYKNVNSWYGGMVLAKDQTLSNKIRSELDAWPEFSRTRLYAKIRQSAAIDLLGWEPIFSPFLSRIFRYGYLNDIARINRLTAIELDTSRHDELPKWYQSRFTSMQARRVLEQWPHVESHGWTRIEKAHSYHEGIKEHSELVKPPAPENQRHIYTYYPLQADNATNLLKWLMHFRRDLATQHLKNCAHLESFKEFRHECPVAEKVSRSIVLLPTYPSYRDEEVRRNLEVVQWYQENDCPEYSRGAVHPKEIPKRIQYVSDESPIPSEPPPPQFDLHP
jgi:dTDP-4-amino-4,6-dideoxygalactose transaminase